MSRTPFIATLLLLLPGVWWIAQTAPTWFYSGWNHDPRFYDIYLPGFFVVRLIYGAGDWVSPRYAVAIQDAAVASLLVVVAALLLGRWRAWHAQRWPRLAVGVASLALPWLGVVRPWESAARHGVAVVPLMIAYFGAILVATFCPLSAGMKRALFVMAILFGGTVLLWGLERWEWLYASSLLASFVLLASAAVRSTLALVSHDDELQRAKPAQAIELRR